LPNRHLEGAVSADLQPEHGPAQDHRLIERGILDVLDGPRLARPQEQQPHLADQIGVNRLDHRVHDTVPLAGWRGVDCVELRTVRSQIVHCVGPHEGEGVTGHRPMIHASDLVEPCEVVAGRATSTSAEQIEQTASHQRSPPRLIATRSASVTHPNPRVSAARTSSGVRRSARPHRAIRSSMGSPTGTVSSQRRRRWSMSSDVQRLWCM
jgi:hypothetical protein